MAIDRELLNLKVPTAESKVSTGTYQNANSNSAVVLRVKHDTSVVHYVSFASGTLRVEVVPLFSFVRDWPHKLPNYPARRALRVMDNHSPYEALAKKLVRSILNG